jgi:hypothetical protein
MESQTGKDSDITYYRFILQISLVYKKIKRQTKLYKIRMTTLKKRS